jgi:hypothetical protein
MSSKLPEESGYCRRCMTILPLKDFYDCTDAGFVDKNMKLSVCKNCINSIYEELFSVNQSMEKTIHKMCTTLNVSFSNEAVSATKAHINTLLEGGKKVNAVFGIYKQKLLATQKTMEKNSVADMSYEDVGTIYTTENINLKEIPIPEDIKSFWGKDLQRDEIEFLETQYTNFKQTHKADTYAEITLLKQVCYTLLDIKQARAQGDSTDKLVKELQELMKNLAISPKESNAANANKGNESFGLWIQDIEQFEPAQWLMSDPRGDIYRDVGNVDEYFKKYIVRPLKNFIQGSKDFNLDDDSKEEADYGLTPEELADFRLIDDGDTGD